jgi:hypothetical protein
MSEKCASVIFSNRAYNAIVDESFKMNPVETGGILLGHILDNGYWIVMEVLPPGINSIHEIAYFEYDEAFVNYLANSVATKYAMKLDVLGLWHRHPGSMDVFSGTDDGTNLTFARMNPNGAISGLVNIDPAFRFTLRHVTAPLHYEIVEFEVGDDLIPEEFFELRQYPAKGLHPEIGGGAVDEKKNCGTSTADKSENRFKQNKRRKRSAKEIFHKTLPYICVAIASCLITLLCCRAPKVAANKEDGDVVTNATTGRPAATNKGLFDKIKSWFEKDAGEVNNTGETQIKEDATCAPEQGNSPTPSTTETTSI